MAQPTRESPSGPLASSDRLSIALGRPSPSSGRWADAFLLVDASWTVTFVSCSEPDLSCEQPIGRDLSELFPDTRERWGEWWPALRSCMERGLLVSFIEHDGQLGASREVRAYPVASGGLGLTFRDVTAQLQREATWASERQQLEQQVQTLSRGTAELSAELSVGRSREADERRRSELEQQLIGIVSHDLRNPLQVVRFSATLGLKAAGEDARQRRAFERILASSDRALGIINTLLDFTRVRFGAGIGLEPAPADLHALTAQVVDEALITRPERTIGVSRLGDGKGVWDVARLGQVIQNLVGNALQHTTEDSRVQVRTRGEGALVVLEVHNDGPPIAEQDLPRLFEPFRRGRGARSGDQSLGLGLHIASHIVRAHGGTIHVRSTEEEGTTFTVRLPRFASTTGAAVEAPQDQGAS